MKIIDTLLLLALPASGKSEVRTYIAGLSPEVCERDFHIGPTLQLDDYPYVHFMHRIDDELYKRGIPYIFYKGQTRPFKNSFEWGTLIMLLNEDYNDLLQNRVIEVGSAAQHLFDRLDRGRGKVGLPQELGNLPYRIRCQVAEAMEEECRGFLEEKNKINSQRREGKTIVIEFARGGANGAAFPLTPPQGYEYAFSILSEEILNRASILYVLVSPEESRRKNIERGLPDAEGSILHHCVPLEVMLDEYGCDDIQYLIKQSDKQNTICVNRIVEVMGIDNKRHYAMKKWYLPVAIFDNRVDKTTFVRGERSKWKTQEIEVLHNALKDALTLLAGRL